MKVDVVGVLVFWCFGVVLRAQKPDVDTVDVVDGEDEGGVSLRHS